MNYRQFKLINEVGAEYDMCDTRHFFANPDGLGFEKNITSSQTGNAFVLVNEKNNQQTITGEMIFSDYDEYAAFKEFIVGSGLKIAYCPADSETWYYRTVRVKRLNKSEISRGTQRLHCNVDFLCFSQWYESVKAERTIYEIPEISKFPLVFPFTFSDKNINEVIINNPKSEEAPCCITLIGPCSNPGWNLIHHGQIVANGKVNLSLDENDALVVDANVENLKIVKVSDGEETNVYQNSDFSTDRFIYAPSGQSILRFYHDAPDPLDITVEVKIVADTV